MDFFSRHQQHLAKCRAAAGNKQASRKPTAANKIPEAEQEYVVWAKVVENDVNHLKATYPEHDERAKHMPAMIDKYRDYLKGWIASGQTHQNDVLVRCAIWAADCGQYDYAIELTDHALSMKTGMKRDLPTLVTDTVLQSKTAGDDAILMLVKRVDAADWIINHPLMAKVYKWAAKHFEKSDPAEALRFAKAAHQAYPNVAVKGLMESLEKVVEGQASSKDDA